MGSPSVLAFATGTILGSAFLHLIPESFAFLPGLEAGGIMLCSALFLFFLETWMGWDCNHRHHHHTEECHGDHHHPVKPLVWVNLVGDGVHNFIDGALIATSFLVDVKLGWMTVLGIALHEIPQELSDFLILRHGGLSTKRALLCNLLGATTAFAGATAVVGFSGYTGWEEYLYPIGAGCFLYLAMVDLLPEVKGMIEVRKEHWGIPFLSLIAGIVLMGGIAINGHAGHDHSTHEGHGHGPEETCGETPRSEPQLHHEHNEHNHEHGENHQHEHGHGSHSHSLGELNLPEDILKSLKEKSLESNSVSEGDTSPFPHDHSDPNHRH
jgi:zinc and cadmium transporter